ncbi:hypothetical protein ACHAW5_005474 [Stephanodiscus triporus]|uniref:Uncharacterized protein n=1 Tax=Stephanodiscus triporus TaxID=2934178 RepID=A0ABD3NK36_9STRA
MRFQWLHRAGSDTGPDGSSLKSLPGKIPMSTDVGITRLWRQSQDVGITDGGGGRGREARLDEASDDRVVDNLLARRAEAKRKKSEAERMMMLIEGLSQLKHAASGGGGGWRQRREHRRVENERVEEAVVELLPKMREASILNSSKYRWRGGSRRNDNDWEVKSLPAKKAYDERRMLVEISNKNDVKTKDSLKASIKLLRQRKSKLENDVRGLSSELANATARRAELLDDIQSRGEELASLQRDARSVGEGKERSEAECKALRAEAKALAERLGGEKIALLKAEKEREEALRLLKEAVDEHDRMEKATNSRIAELEAEATKRMNQVLADEDRILRERARLLAMANEADAVGARLKKEAQRIAKRQAELDEEKRHRGGEIQDQAKELKMRAVILQAQEDSIANREVSCRESEEALSERERVCAEREGEIEDREKNLKMRNVVVQEKEDACEQRTKFIKDEETKLMGVNISLNNRAEELAKMEDACSRREGEMDVALRNLEERERNCDAKLNKALLHEELVSKREKSEREALCAKREEDVASRTVIVTEREKSCAQCEIDLERRRRQVVEDEDAQSKERERLRSLEWSLAEREAACSKSRDDLSKRLGDITEHERCVRRDQEKVQSERKVLADEREEFDNLKGDFQQEKIKSQTLLDEQSEKLAAQLVAQERSMHVSMSQLEQEQRRLDDEGSKLQRELINLAKQTEILVTREESLNRRERMLSSQADQLSRAMEHLSKDRSQLESKASAVAAKEEALIKERADIDRQKSRLIESSKKTADGAHKREKEVAAFMERLKGTIEYK